MYDYGTQFCVCPVHVRHALGACTHVYIMIKLIT